MDALREGDPLCLGHSVQHIKGSLEQGFSDHPPIHALAVLLIVQLHHKLAYGRSAICSDRLCGRGCSATVGHPASIA